MAGEATHQIAIMGAIGRGIRTVDSLVAHLPIDRKGVLRPLSRLVGRAYVERDEDGAYQLTESGLSFLASGAPLKSGRKGPRDKVRRPKTENFRQRAWAAMRLQSRFVQADILMLAARPDDGDAASNLRTFVMLLVRAGYLIVLPDRVPGSGLTRTPQKVFRLTRNTGELAPAFRETRGVMHDANTGEDFPCRK
ncbi:hypothetical protein J2X65_002007 [Ancylobacter sp. 3268]|uniref:hypothetical protein n=1 Tax=Ancylobacter sp. 3268 TaxID=2817752 RepID=UPI002855A449|nr:hypothetical protein [Ancylobacter sp. 3268]MDR6952648.1 hypothetical protein [Ancylobacter sp. 3268]